MERYSPYPLKSTTEQNTFRFCPRKTPKNTSSDFMMETRRKPSFLKNQLWTEQLNRKHLCNIEILTFGVTEKLQKHIISGIWEIQCGLQSELIRAQNKKMKQKHYKKRFYKVFNKVFYTGKKEKGLKRLNLELLDNNGTTDMKKIYSNLTLCADYGKNEKLS